MRSLKIISRVSLVLTRIFVCDFSTKKSSEQLAYFNHRLQSLPGFTYKPVKPTTTIANFMSKYTNKQTNEQSPIQLISGRISSIRKHGKTTFIDLREEHLKLQVPQKQPAKTSRFAEGRGGGQRTGFRHKKGVIVSAIIKARGYLGGESVPMDVAGVRISERQRDKISKQAYRLNNESVITANRQTTVKDNRVFEEYIEVQTPTLSPSCGGAIAKPFQTYHNDHKMSLFMRIAPELFLKRLLIGGIPKVFQIGKNFRNQSIDQTHNPEFTSCELYCAYSDYREMINLTKQLICSIVKKSLGQDHCKIKVNGKEIDLGAEWKEIDFISGLQQQTGVKFPLQFQSKQSLAFLSQLCSKYEVACDEPKTAERMLDKLAGHFLEPLSFDVPVLLMHHPRILSPLAKPLVDRPHLTARFQLFIRGWQFVNSYTELNDPQIQRANTPEDQQFVQALQYGLMPCAGWGLGIDRLIMLLGECERIQDVIIFPLLKDKQE